MNRRQSGVHSASVDPVLAQLNVLDGITNQAVALMADLACDLEECGGSGNFSSGNVDELVRRLLKEKAEAAEERSVLASLTSNCATSAEASRLVTTISTPAIDYSRSADYVAFKERLWNVRPESSSRDMPRILPSGEWAAVNEAEDDGAGFSVTQAAVSTVCPVLRVTFRNPLRSRRCKHTYDAEGIRGLLAGQRSIGCPVSGCRKAVSEEDLEVDEAMVRRLKRAAKQSLFE